MHTRTASADHVKALFKYLRRGRRHSRFSKHPKISPCLASHISWTPSPQNHNNITLHPCYSSQGMQGDHVARAIDFNYFISAYLRNIHITQSDSCNASYSVEVVHGEVNNQAYNPRALDPQIYSLRDLITNFIPTKFNTLTNMPFCQTTKILPTKFNTHTVFAMITYTQALPNSDIAIYMLHILLDINNGKFHIVINIKVFTNSVLRFYE